MASHILGIVILDSEGERVVAQYAATRQYSKAMLFSTYADQRLFEKDLLAKSLRLPSRNEVEVLLGNDTIVLYNLVNDLNIYIIGVMNENEICLLEVMNTFYNALHSLTNGNVTKRTVEENMGSVFLLLDELLEDDLVFETDSNVIVNRIQMNSNEEAKIQEQTALTSREYEHEKKLFFLTFNVMFLTSPHHSCVHLVFLFFFFSYIDAGYIQRHVFPLSYPEIRPARPYVSSISSNYIHQKRSPPYLDSFIDPKPTSFRIPQYRQNEPLKRISDSTNVTTEKKIESLEKQLEDLRTVENVLKDTIVQKQALNHDMDTKNQFPKKNLSQESQPTEMEEEMEDQERSLRERETEEDANDELLEAKMSHRETEDDLQDLLQDIKDDVKDNVKQKLKKKMEKDLERQMEKVAKRVEDKEENIEKAAEAEDLLENQWVKNLLHGDQGNVEKAIHDLSSKSSKVQEKLQETQRKQRENIDEKNALNHSLEDHCFDHTIASKDLPTHDQTSFRQECKGKQSQVFSEQGNSPPSIHFIAQSQYHALPEEVAETLADGSSTGELPSPPSSSSSTAASSKKKSLREHRQRQHTPHSSQRSKTRAHDEDDFSQQSTHPHSKKKRSKHKNEDEKKKVEKLSTFQWLYLAVLFPLGLASSAFLVVLFV